MGDYTKSKPQVSIITPSYNQGNYIERTILSIKNQNYPNYEHIIVDAGSKDGTIEITKKYPKVRLVVKKSRQTEALNIGFKEAKGEIIGWLSSDDTYSPKIFEKVVDYLKNNPDVDLIYSDCYFIDSNDNILGEWNTTNFSYFRNLNYAQMIPQPTVFFRRSVFERVGYLDEKLDYGMDFDFFIRVSKKCKIRYIPNEKFARFRLHSSSKTMGQRKKFEPEVIKIRSRHGAIVPYFLVKFVHWSVGLFKKRL